MSFNVDLLPKSPETSGTSSAPVLPVEKLDAKLNRFPATPSELPFGVVPIRPEEVNRFAPENPRLDMITTPAKMSIDAMKPVGPGATIFNPFNLRMG